MNWKNFARLAGITLMLGILLAPPAIAQLDTLYFDDFVDNRHNWNIWSNENGKSEIEDGYLNIVKRQRKGRFSIRTFALELSAPDTFVYEIGLAAESFNFLGAVYEYDTTRKGNMGTYRAFGLSKKDIYSYTYTSGQNRIYFGWRAKKPELDPNDLVFRLTYGKGQYHFFLNDHHLKTIKSGKEPTWKYWGWVLKGYGNLKIDYLLLKG